MKKDFLLFILVSIVLFSCATTYQGKEHTHAGFTKHYEESLFNVTRNSLFSVEVVMPEGHLKVGKNNIDLIVHDKSDRDVVRANIRVDAYMPDMGHGIDIEPVIVEKGGGLYQVRDISLTMPGHYQLIVTVQRGSETDRAVFDFPQVGEMTMHKHILMPEGIDTSRTNTSEKGIYRISYTPEIDPIRINTIHSWKVKIQNTSGQAVTGATVRIKGDMPEHGHGLPTEPVVVEETEPGVYIIDGFKFHMPGWWVVNLEIISPLGTDTVQFQLYLK
ncbi:hypothetical protein JZK55_05060 [Dissulfurispira thermophila]|uniref:YtkA-like domain-containing protein n=2 Tax=root TaxID=1 RepID=A0A7G1GYY1_9BACT|nr:FixH family protein [Dissulfurispira thermophila]BCB95584.1 hypothetical protein JZK55_05060 [Dissulfurispira thermophila]